MNLSKPLLNSDKKNFSIDVAKFFPLFEREIFFYEYSFQYLHYEYSSQVFQRINQ